MVIKNTTTITTYKFRIGALTRKDALNLRLLTYYGVILFEQLGFYLVDAVNEQAGVSKSQFVAVAG
ncbi:MAG: hypothetical protein SAK29_08840 [Scytonema sp. PMC 1069.18]|nr:hypothetical protein [Scytonema sp. PMC 1069.18]MEC4884804.1 hypothetical protein [Scytonema sp. PMC 1070.18]